MTEAARIKIDACQLFDGNCCCSACHEDDEYGYELSEREIGNLDVTGCCYVLERIEKLSEAEILALWKAKDDKRP